MSPAYHITGIIQASLFVLSISAAYVQLRFVQERRRRETKEPATDNLSVFAISGSYLAFFSFLLLSTATEPFAHYIFWSRIPACVLAILLLAEFRLDRPSDASAALAPAAAVFFVLALLCTALVPGWSRGCQ